MSKLLSKGQFLRLDFLPKIVIIKPRIVSCGVLDHVSCLLTMLNLCEDLRVPEREVFIDVFKAARVQKTSIQRNNKRPHLPEVS
jgi:hypothetical protein